MAEPPPWADGLPHAALREIVRRVPCAVDRGSMAGACRSWRARLADLPPPPPPLPWLVLPSGGSTRFYCALSGCVHHYETNAPPHGARFFGSHEGAWLFLAFNQNTDHELVNLRADRTFLIPDKYRLQQDGPLAAAHDDMVILAAALSSPPDQGKCVGACIISRWPANVPTLRRFAFWHVEFGGDADAYDLMPDPDPTPPHLQVEDVLCYQGAFYFLTQGEHIRRCEPVHDAGGDLEVLSDVWFFQREGRNYDGLVVQARYLVVSRDELLMVVRLTCGANKPAAAFRVFRALRPVQDVEEVADEDGEDNQVAEADDQGEEIEYPWSWGELDTLGGQMLFVGRGCSRSYKTAEYPGFEDGIYFLDDRSFYDDHCVCERQYPCSNNGRWTQGPPPNIELYFPEQGPSDHSPPAWLLLYNRPYAKALPLDMVREISRHIICDTERVRTLRVCCLVLSDPGARAIQPQLPWLLAASTDGPLLYCLNCGSGGNGTTHTTGAPMYVHTAYHYGAYDGRWLFSTLENGDSVMVNLLTGSRQRLPIEITYRQSGLSYPQKILAATLSAAPDSCRACIGAAIVRYVHPSVKPILTSHFGKVGRETATQIALFRLGDEIAVDPLSAINSPIFVEADDITFYNGSLHCITPDGQFVLDNVDHWKHFRLKYELDGRQPLPDDKTPGCHYLVESRGELLVVVRYYSGAKTARETETFRVFRMIIPEFHVNMGDHDFCICTHQPSLDGRMLFVGRGCSRSYELAQYPEFKDGIYFVDDQSFYDEHIMCHGGNERVYPCSDTGRWIQGPPPNLESFLPGQGSSKTSSPVWILP
ncbi:hypothetical protein SETIT_3G140000v2 [Setaria italica]|uniref:KIB1-4 beta-propeller domain-containing protein n=1 Tax=Setaria italica TaxID=4555 RepID=A0A368QER4_SETIT|nr:hypothetical protein SETIT_3G140000v2 [Setaria italica]